MILGAVAVAVSFTQNPPCDSPDHRACPVCSRREWTSPAVAAVESFAAAVAAAVAVAVAATVAVRLLRQYNTDRGSHCEGSIGRGAEEEVALTRWGVNHHAAAR